MLHETEQFSAPEQNGIISLKNLLVYDNPNLSQYEGLIRENNKDSTMAGMTEPFSNNWEQFYYDRDSFYHSDEIDDKKSSPKRYEKTILYLTSKLQDSVLVDVGGGPEKATGWIPMLAKKCKVKTYISVDRNCIELNPLEGRFVSHSMDMHMIPKQDREHPMEDIQVNADMLDFIARLPNDSSNFIINGIDGSILKNNNYLRALGGELIRATKIGGIIFGISSEGIVWGIKINPLFNSLFKNSTNQLMGETNRFLNPNFFMFEKK